MARFNFVALALATCLSTIAAHPSTAPRALNPRAASGFTCGVEPTAEFLREVEQLAVAESNVTESAADVASFAAAATITVQTYFHVVARSTALSGGYVPQSALTQQLAVLNDNFGPSGFAFVLAGTDYTINTSWASDGDELAMKKALRKGDYKALNVYFLYSVGGDLGYCYFPTTAASGSTAFYTDGCSILYTTVPGGSATGYNLGKTTTHEVGHWMGILHTFQGNSCTGSGDSVSDTPQQLSYSTGCPEGRDSCPSAAGLDPIHNYMDYSTDACYEEFTAGQNTRMLSMWNTYRA